MPTINPTMLKSRESNDRRSRFMVDPSCNVGFSECTRGWLQAHASTTPTPAVSDAKGDLEYNRGPVHQRRFVCVSCKALEDRS